MCRYMAEKVIQVLNQVKCNFTIDHFVLNCALRGGQIKPTLIGIYILISKLSLVHDSYV